LVADPALSPDGKTIAFSWAGDLWAVPIEGGNARPLTRHSGRDTRPIFSPDGQFIAFNSNRGDGVQVFVMPASGGTPRQITFHTGGQTLECYDPSGQSVIVSARRDHHWYQNQAARFFRVRLDQRTAEELLFDDYGDHGQLSPDGKKLLFCREGEAWWRKGYVGSQQSQIWLYDLEAKSFRKLIDRDGGARWPLWKPDASGFYFTARHDGAMNIWEYDFQSEQARPRTSLSDDSVAFPALSRDGSTLVFRHLFDLYRWSPAKDEPPVKITITIDGDLEREPTERRVATSAQGVAFTNDGLEIAFIAGGDLWVMDTELLEPRPVTITPEEERSPVFSPDGLALYVISDKEGQADLHRITRADPARYWWQQNAFQIDRLTSDAEVESSPIPSPDGSKIAYLRTPGDLWIADADGKNARKLVPAFTDLDFDWSPDGKWIAYATSDEFYNSDVWIIPTDGSKPAVNVSMHPNNDANPRWSPDGKLLAFSGTREEGEVDAFFVYLRESDDDRQPRDRKLALALEKMQKARKKPEPAKGDTPRKDEPAKAAGEPAKDEPRKDEPRKDETRPPSAGAEKKSPPEVVIDFENLHQRIRRIPVPNSPQGVILWSPDSKRLAFNATIDGKPGLYAVEIPDDLKPKPLLTGAPISQPRWLEAGNQVVGLSGGAPASLVPGGKESLYRFRANQQFDRKAKFRAGFDLAWRTMRDRFYDERLGNRNWDAIRRKYADAAAEAPDLQAFADVVQLMLGELNGSHLAFRPGARSYGPPEPEPPTDPAGSGGAAWRPITAHLGLRFDADHKGPGLKIKDVLDNGPAEKIEPPLQPGDIVLQIDGQTVDPAFDLTQILNGPLDRDITLSVRNAAGQERAVALRPIPGQAVFSLLYEKFVHDTRDVVARKSAGKLGYLHVKGMDFPSFHRFQQELYEVGYGKDGLIIDVRNNGGGSTADHLLTALAQPLHAITVGRNGKPGYPQDRVIYASWHKPIVVLCNQNSFSNAEIFSHAIKTIKRGPLVGVPTAGGVISTGGTTIMDLGFLRLPGRGWFVLDTGQDMELNGAVPDHIVWPEPHARDTGADPQLEKAIEVLLKDVETFKARPQPKLIKATERIQP
jgi:tricorn protease